MQGAPPQQALSEYLFHLRRGFGQLNRPPPEGMDYGRDKILVHRKNRYIGLSREGTRCGLRHTILVSLTTQINLTYGARGVGCWVYRD